ncbi:MAG: 4'-phosphopantetheinyl transferase superfamily protein [Clostridia bacterium]|nr:4'-phosphopantetheinyl transferase superfamily protein [Clostridia bacterium]
MLIRLAFFSCSDLPEDLTAVISALPFGEAERARLVAIRNGNAKRESLSALLALRSLCALEDLTILRDENGKPRFSADGAPQFSLSHAGGLAVAAICEQASIGVDLELARNTMNPAAVAARFFTEAEQKEFSEQGDFFALWTKKEAKAKCLGVPLPSVLSSDLALSTRTYRCGEFTLSLAAEEAFSVEFLNDFSQIQEVLL